jgi:hypothetical protein
LIREFEREARTDGMPVNELNFRKKQYVQELNGFIGLKKAYSSAQGQRGELLDGAKSEIDTLSSALCGCPSLLPRFRLRGFPAGIAAARVLLKPCAALLAHSSLVPRSMFVVTAFLTASSAPQA